MEEIQERLGHTNIQITLDIYTLVTKKSINNTTKNLLVTLIFRKRRSVQKKTPSNFLESVLKR
jgi:integrase